MLSGASIDREGAIPKSKMLIMLEIAGLIRSVGLDRKAAENGGSLVMGRLFYVDNDRLIKIVLEKTICHSFYSVFSLPPCLDLAHMSKISFVDGRF